MIGYECVIYQKVNYILDCLYFRENSQSVRTIPKADHSTKNKYSNNVKSR